MQQQGKEESSTRTSFNAIVILASGWAWCVLPFLRWNMGSNAIGIRGLLAILVMWIYTVATQCPQMVPFFCVWLGCVVLQRLRTGWLVARGVVMHSRYAGDPLVMKFLPFIRSVGTAKLLEVMICFWVGLWLSIHWLHLGWFVWLGAAGLAIANSIDDQAIRNRKQAMRDAEIEQHFYADLHRGRIVDY